MHLHGVRGIQICARSAQRCEDRTASLQEDTTENMKRRILAVPWFEVH